MKPWVKKVNRLRDKVRKAPFDRGYFYRQEQPAPEYASDPNLTWQEKFKRGLEEAPGTDTPRVQVNGWVLAMGREPKDSGPALWHLQTVAVPYRRPLYDKDWKTLAAILTHLHVPREVVEQEILRWGNDIPYAPLWLKWEVGYRERPPEGIEQSLLEFYGWPEDWRTYVDRFRETVVERTMDHLPLSHEEARKAIREARRTDDKRVQIEITAELAAQATESQTRILLHGWSLVANRVHRPEEVPEWHFSAKLHPFGRSSKSRDWSALGEILQQFGIPDPISNKSTSLITPFETTNPNSAYHWHWKEDDGVGEQQA